MFQRVETPPTSPIDLRGFSPFGDSFIIPLIDLFLYNFQMLKDAQAIKEIRRATGDEDTISTDPEDLKAHGYSEWSSTNIDGLPVAVAYPKTTAEVSKIAKICYKYRVPIIPFSGGSSLEGNFSAPYGGVSVDFAYMDQILNLHEADMDIVVQPSVSWMELNEELAKRQSGLFFPVDPGPSKAPPPPSRLISCVATTAGILDISYSLFQAS